VLLLRRERVRGQVSELPREIPCSRNASFSDHVGLVRVVQHAHRDRHELVWFIQLGANRYQTLSATVRVSDLAKLHIGNVHEEASGGYDVAA
jgi:hypothetical protein